MANTDLCGGATAKLTPGVTVLRSPVVSVVGKVATDTWDLFKLPARTKILASVINTVDDGVASSLYDIGFAEDAGTEIADDVDANATAAVDNGAIAVTADVKTVRVTLAVAATSPAAGSFEVVLVCAQM